MPRNLQRMPVGSAFVLVSVLLNGIILESAYVDNHNLYWLLMLSLPMLVLAIYVQFRKTFDQPKNVEGAYDVRKAPADIIIHHSKENTMQETKNRIVLKKDDYNLLVKYIYSRLTPLSVDNRNAEQLYEELKDAEIIEDDFPTDVIGINSVVEVEEKSSGRQMKFRIVLPTDANLGKQRLSVFAPLGIALMGYRKGQKVSWQMPSGKKEFYVKNVTNPA